MRRHLEILSEKTKYRVLCIIFYYLCKNMVYILMFVHIFILKPSGKLLKKLTVVICGREWGVDF